MVAVALLPRLRIPTSVTSTAVIATANYSRSMEKPVETSLRTKLSTELQSAYLDVINESHMHCVPLGSETHFKVVVVSQKFDDLPLIKRHRLVNEIVKEELAATVHALSITAKTQEPWESVEARARMSENEPAIRFVRSLRGGRLLELNGYLFRINVRKDDRVYWKCKSHGCRATAILTETGAHISSKQLHNHEPCFIDDGGGGGGVRAPRTRHVAWSAVAPLFEGSDVPNCERTASATAVQPSIVQPNAGQSMKFSSAVQQTTSAPTVQSTACTPTMQPMVQPMVSAFAVQPNEVQPNAVQSVSSSPVMQDNLVHLLAPAPMMQLEVVQPSMLQATSSTLSMQPNAVQHNVVQSVASEHTFQPAASSLMVQPPASAPATHPATSHLGVRPARHAPPTATKYRRIEMARARIPPAPPPPREGVAVRLVASGRGGQMLVLNGFVYRLNVRNERADRVYWKCRTRGCRASAILAGDGSYVSSREVHNHAVETDPRAGAATTTCASPRVSSAASHASPRVSSAASRPSLHDPTAHVSPHGPCVIKTEPSDSNAGDVSARVPTRVSGSAASAATPGFGDGRRQPTRRGGAAARETYAGWRRFVGSGETPCEAHGTRFFSTQRGRRLLAVNGFHYRVNVHKDGGKTYWKCRRRGCPATAITTAHSASVLAKETHTHPPADVDASAYEPLMIGGNQFTLPPRSITEASVQQPRSITDASVQPPRRYDAIASASAPPRKYDAIANGSVPQQQYDAISDASGPPPRQYDAITDVSADASALPQSYDVTQLQPYNSIADASASPLWEYDATPSASTPLAQPYDAIADASAPPPRQYHATVDASSLLQGYGTSTGAMAHTGGADVAAGLSSAAAPTSRRAPVERWPCEAAATADDAVYHKCVPCGEYLSSEDAFYRHCRQRHCKLFQSTGSDYDAAEHAGCVAIAATSTDVAPPPWGELLRDGSVRVKQEPELEEEEEEDEEKESSEFVPWDDPVAAAFDGGATDARHDDDEEGGDAASYGVFDLTSAATRDDDDDDGDGAGGNDAGGCDAVACPECGDALVTAAEFSQHLREHQVAPAAARFGPGRSRRGTARGRHTAGRGRRRPCHGCGRSFTIGALLMRHTAKCARGRATRKRALRLPTRGADQRPWHSLVDEDVAVPSDAFSGSQRASESPTCIGTHEGVCSPASEGSTSTVKLKQADDPPIGGAGGVSDPCPIWPSMALYKCPVCGAAFYDKQALERHALLHGSGSGDSGLLVAAAPGNIDTSCVGNAQSTEYRSYRIASGVRGAPQYNITKPQLESFLACRFTNRKMAEMLKVSTKTIQRKMRQFGLAVLDKPRVMAQEELDAAVKDAIHDNRQIGANNVHVKLRNKGINVPRDKVRESVRRVDPFGVALRSRPTLKRREYSVKGPNSL
ncbi:PREDICTED: uncharacterized protein LOC106811348 [Priapulus caudatus]|uniref:Uncharacterized protein LOC106811348 n=1 Tax=Priapulus caudatus TaxID=37621 RepID=A0ABM1EDZ9_PRICU|nr:PREDICTED: uncharacterized protein LOC106811348 [Priapulus caudatus]